MKKEPIANIDAYGDQFLKGTISAPVASVIAKHFSKHQFNNYAHNGETVCSLLERLEKQDIPVSRACILWIGINDQLASEFWMRKIQQVSSMRVWTSTNEEFAEYYHQILALLYARTSYLVVITPLCVGEVYTSISNEHLREKIQIIESLVSKYKHATVVDAHEHLTTLKKPSLFISRHPFSNIQDLLGARRAATRHKLAIKRKTQLTYDGVHLLSGEWIVSQVVKILREHLH